MSFGASIILRLSGKEGISDDFITVIALGPVFAIIMAVVTLNSGGKIEPAIALYNFTSTLI